MQPVFGSPTSLHDRLRVDVLFRPSDENSLAEDVRAGLTTLPKQLPPKYFYDAVGSELFDRICHTPEYYPTRTEQGLLVKVAEEIVRLVNPTDIVELGSGAARKTRCLLDAAQKLRLGCRYVPFDVSETMLRQSGATLLRAYPWLTIHGIVGDYTKHLFALPSGRRRLIMFIGSTIGNFEHEEAVRFLRALRKRMGPSDALLLGVDLIKDAQVLHAAYNDAEGVTEAFNKNVLQVINRELLANFRLDRFEHVAFFDSDKSRIEMHLRSRIRHEVRVESLGMTVDFADGETIRTEISRKFSKKSVTETLAAAGFTMRRWHTPDNDYFGLALGIPSV
jgi:L-histidine N-alpha-methyltransferase